MRFFLRKKYLRPRCSSRLLGYGFSVDSTFVEGRTQNLLSDDQEYIKTSDWIFAGFNLNNIEASVHSLDLKSLNHLHPESEPQILTRRQSTAESTWARTERNPETLFEGNGPNDVRVTEDSADTAVARERQDRLSTNCRLTETDTSFPSNHTKAHPKTTESLSSTNGLKEAKNHLVRAIQNRRVFTIIGPYNKVRLSLQNRGWVEKVCQLEPTSSLKESNSANDSKLLHVGMKGVNRNQRKDFRHLMNRMFRSVVPTLIWSLRKSDVDFRLLHEHQMVNHFIRAPFTTKTGLCRVLRELRWVDNMDPDHFFPRCYILSDDDEKQSFIYDFRVTACSSLLKMVCRINDLSTKSDDRSQDIDDFLSTCVQVDRSGWAEVPRPETVLADGADMKVAPMINDNQKQSLNQADKLKTEPIDRILEMALSCCATFLHRKYNKDIDYDFDALEYDPPWPLLLDWYYNLCK